MDEKKPGGEGVPIPVKASDEVQAGAFSNAARISHTNDSFLVDWLIVHSSPPFARLQARVLLTPGHAKRFLRALEENLQRYEQVHGPIRDTEVPPPPAGGYLQ